MDAESSETGALNGEESFARSGEKAMGFGSNKLGGGPLYEISGEAGFGPSSAPSTFEQGDSLSSLLVHESSYSSIFTPASTPSTINPNYADSSAHGVPVSAVSLAAPTGFSFDSLASFSNSAIGTMSALSSTIQTPTVAGQPFRPAGSQGASFAGINFSFSAPNPGFTINSSTNTNSPKSLASQSATGSSTGTATKRKKKTTGEQLSILTAEFDANMNPSSERRQELAEKLTMTPRAVQIWFQNKRAKARLELKRSRAAATGGDAINTTSLLSEGLARGRASRRNSVGSLTARTPPTTLQSLSNTSISQASEKLLTPASSVHGTPSLSHGQASISKFGAAGVMLESLFATRPSTVNASVSSVDVLPTPIPSPLLSKQLANGERTTGNGVSPSTGTPRNELLVQLDQLLNVKARDVNTHNLQFGPSSQLGHSLRQSGASVKHPSREDVEKINAQVVQELSQLVQCGLDVTALVPLLTHPLDYEEKATAVQLLRVLHRSLTTGSNANDGSTSTNSLSNDIAMKRKQRPGIFNGLQRAESFSHIYKPQINTTFHHRGSFSGGAGNAADKSKSLEALLSPSLPVHYPSQQLQTHFATNMEQSSAHETCSSASSSASSFTNSQLLASCFNDIKLTGTEKSVPAPPSKTSFSFEDEMMMFGHEQVQESNSGNGVKQLRPPLSSASLNSNLIFDNGDAMAIENDPFNEFLNI